MDVGRHAGEARPVQTAKCPACDDPYITVGKGGVLLDHYRRTPGGPPITDPPKHCPGSGTRVGCEMPGDCGEVCHCGDSVEGHGNYQGHSAVPMMCGACDPPVKCPKCGGEEASVYMHLHKCP